MYGTNSEHTFYSVKGAEIIVESWRLEFNNHRPHSGLGYMTPVAFAAGFIPEAEPQAKPKEYKNCLTNAKKYRIMLLT